MKNIQTISIKCDNEKTLELAEMTELQGGLKERTDIDYDKIKLSIIQYGFSFPFYIWKSGKTNYILDGHGRFETLCRMQKDGYIIPPLPVFYIKAKDKAEAKQKLLRLNSTYGKMTKESVLEFAEDLEINFDEISLPDTVIDFSMGGGIDEEGNSQIDGYYTTKIETPIYEIKGEKPLLKDCYDTTKTDELIKEIEKADIDQDIKNFLKIASYRHTRINFTKIAEYYAHAPKEVQELLENNALVIIDFNKAIEKGFVEMNKEIDKLRQESPDYE